MRQKLLRYRMGVPRLPNLHIAGAQHGFAFGAASGCAVRKQHPQERVLSPQTSQQHSRGARFTERHRMQPNQLRRRLSSLCVVPKTLIDSHTITWLSYRAPGEFAAQQWLGQAHQRRVNV